MGDTIEARFTQDAVNSDHIFNQDQFKAAMEHMTSMFQAMQKLAGVGPSQETIDVVQGSLRLAMMLHCRDFANVVPMDVS